MKGRERKLLSWNVAGRVRLAGKQVLEAVSRAPDVVALQEVTRRTRDVLRAELLGRGFSHIIDSFDLAPDASALVGPRRYGQMVASKFPLDPLPPEEFPVPWPERVLSCVVVLGGVRVELHTTHVPPGSSNGWIKVETFEGIYRRLRERPCAHRVLCGDFNAPQAELPDGTVVTWGQRVREDGTVVTRKSIRRGPGERWDAAERSVLTGLSAHDMPDVYRKLHGYGSLDFSWFNRNGQGRRFDHVFASRGLDATGCRYLHRLRETGLSDHSAVEVVFAPRGYTPPEAAVQ